MPERDRISNRSGGKPGDQIAEIGFDWAEGEVIKIKEPGTPRSVTDHLTGMKISVAECFSAGGEMLQLAFCDCRYAFRGKVKAWANA